MYYPPVDLHAVMVSVDYSDILRITLPYNRQHFKQVTIITTPADASNVCPIAEANDARVLTTDLFYHAGARFNKFLALEWGLSQIGRKGWICNLDADVLWPKHAPLERILRQGFLYTPLRRMYPHIPKDASEIPDERNWKNYPVHRNQSEWAGYSQVYHADDPVLGDPPWHQVDWLHAGGADSFFQAKWPRDRKIRPDWHVLHLGEAGSNWMGRATPYANGESPPDAEIKRRQVSEIWVSRRGKKGEEAFKQERYTDGTDLPSI